MAGVRPEGEHQPFSNGGRVIGMLLKKASDQAPHWRGRGDSDRNPLHRWRSRRDSGPNRQARPDVAPRSRQRRQRCPQSISRSARGRRHVHRPRPPMDTPGRRFLCARCRTAVLICSHSDRGNRYCTPHCAHEARQQALRDAGRRYQTGLPGRTAHAQRQRRYRARKQKVTHQGSPPPPPAAPLTPEPTPPAHPLPGHCCRCHRPLSDRVRQDFLRCRIRRHPLDRSIHASSP